MKIRLFPLLWTAACGGSGKLIRDSVVAERDTAPWTDTGDDTGTEVDPDLAELAVYPDGLTVGVGATLALRLVGTWTDGTVADVDGRWASADAEIASVADGVAIAESAGDVEIEGSYGGRSAVGSITVRDDLALSLRVVDASTGDPLAGAHARVDGGDQVETDSDGAVEIPVATGGPVILDVYTAGRVPVTVWGTVARSLSIPLEDVQSDESAALYGTLDWSDVPEADWDEEQAGLVAASLASGPLLVGPEDLFAESRTVELLGVDAELPGNVVIQGAADDWETPAIPGEAAAWSLAGPLPVSEFASGVDGTGDVLKLIEAHLDDMVWDWEEAGTVAAGGRTEVDVAPAQDLDSAIDVSVGDLPLGFSGDEDGLVLVGEDVDGVGIVVTGLGVGTGDVAARSASPGIAASKGTVALVIAQVDGLGSDGAICASVAPVDGDSASLPAMQRVPDVIDFEGATRGFALETDERATWVRVRIDGGSDTVRDVFLAAGLQSGTLVNPGYEFGYGRTTWSVLAVERATDTFDGLVAAGVLSPLDAVAGARTSARIVEKFYEEPE